MSALVLWCPSLPLFFAYAANENTVGVWYLLRHSACTCVGLDFSPPRVASCRSLRAVPSTLRGWGSGLYLCAVMSQSGLREPSLCGACVARDAPSGAAVPYPTLCLLRRLSINTKMLLFISLPFFFFFCILYFVFCLSVQILLSLLSLVWMYSLSPLV